MFNLVMHWINRPLRRAKVDERLSWWSVGQTCYQVPLSTIDKLVLYRYVKNVLSVRATNGIDGLGFEARPSEQTQTTDSLIVRGRTQKMRTVADRIVIVL